MLDLLEVLNGKIGELDKEIARRACDEVIARRLMTIPGVGPITATAIAALAPSAETFTKDEILPHGRVWHHASSRADASRNWGP